MMTVRELIIKLLDFNLDATVSISAYSEESESIHFSWTCDDGASRKDCKHLFLETDHKRLEEDECDNL